MDGHGGCGGVVQEKGRSVEVCGLIFLRGTFRVALHTAMAEAIATEHVRQARGWKLFLLLPRMLLSRPPPRSGFVSKEKLRKRFELFSAGRWQELLADSIRIADEASNAMHRRRRRRNADDSDRRAARDHALVQLGELSAGRETPRTGHSQILVVDHPPSPTIS